VFREHLFLDDEVDGDADVHVQHEQFAAGDLDRGRGTESRREIILDLRYSRKRLGSKMRSSLFNIFAD
jgi:hypothetical protein